MIVSTLNQQKLLEHLRLEYKSMNYCFNEFNDLIWKSAVILATLNILECLSDLTFLALFLDQSKTYNQIIFGFDWIVFLLTLPNVMRQLLYVMLEQCIFKLTRH